MRKSTLQASKRQQAGEVRVFETSQLRPGEELPNYTVRVVYDGNGTTETREKQLTLVGGQTSGTRIRFHSVPTLGGPVRIAGGGRLDVSFGILSAGGTSCDSLGRKSITHIFCREATKAGSCRREPADLCRRISVSREAAAANVAHLAVAASRLACCNCNVTHGLRRGLPAAAASRL